MPEPLSISTEEIFRASIEGNRKKLAEWRKAYDGGTLDIYGHETGAERDAAINRLYGIRD